MKTANPIGLRLIITFKLVRSVVQVVAAAALFYGAAHGLVGDLTAYADRLREHAVHVWSTLVATALLDVTGEAHGITLVATALAGDGLLSGFEGWVLARHYRWGPFLVLASTASFLPFEIVALFHHARPGRMALLILNVAIVAYLLRHVRRHRRGQMAILHA